MIEKSFLLFEIVDYISSGTDCCVIKTFCCLLQSIRLSNKFLVAFCLHHVHKHLRCANKTISIETIQHFQRKPNFIWKGRKNLYLWFSCISQNSTWKFILSNNFSGISKLMSVRISSLNIWNFRRLLPHPPHSSTHKSVHINLQSFRNLFYSSDGRLKCISCTKCVVYDTSAGA